MKKQFFRVKQLADQTFLRADKTDVFNHGELQIADHKVEFIRTALPAISKRIPSASSNQGTEANPDKRKKKYVEYQLGQVLYEQGQKGYDAEIERSLLPGILKECGQVEMDLAKEQAEHDVKVEQMVSTPLMEIIDTDLPNILKHKRNLSKYILDKDSASNRYNAASKNGQKESLKDDMDEADFKVEQHKDVLASEMFNLLRKESEISQYMLQLLKLQRAYHESALKYLEKVIPSLEQKIGDSCVKTMFGLSLEEHQRVTGRQIAFPLELCISALTELGLHEEGLFRVVGGSSKVKRLKLSIDSGCFTLPLLPEYQDVHVLASTLKSYLRELPEPLLTFKLYDEWMNAMRYPEGQKLRAIQEILKKLPKPNRDNLTYLVQFLAKLSKNTVNKMTSSNIAIVIAPNLLWNQDKEMDMHMTTCSTLNMIVELFIKEVDVLFPDDVTPYLSIKRCDLLHEEPEFQRPNLQNVKLVDHEHGSVMMNKLLDHQENSPRPQTRVRKPKPAPNPPVANLKCETDFVNDRGNTVSAPPSYPSGSTTLSRSHKAKFSPDINARPKTVETHVDRSPDSVRRQSLVIEPSNVPLEVEHNAHSKVNETPKAALVNLDDTKTADVTYVSQPAANIQISKAKPIQHISAQTIIADKLTITSNHVYPKIEQNHQPLVENKIKPVAAPRFVSNETQKLPESRSPVLKPENLMTKSLNTMDVDGETVQIRKQSRDDGGIERPSKPLVPTRPATLKAVVKTVVDGNVDPSLQKTQCSMYNVAHKLQPSYVNIQNRNNGGEKFKAGHDNQITEKEKFLGHQTNAEKSSSARSSLENKCNDENLNFSNTVRNRTASFDGNKPDIPPKAIMMKSFEKLHLDTSERTNGNAKPSHMRTQSDGNIADSSSPITTLLQKPPSPRSLNKPTQPPPPPPTNSRPKSEPESTDL